MLKINIITEGLKSYNGIAFLTPIVKNFRNFKSLGLKFGFFTSIKDDVYDCDILIIESKFYANLKKNYGIEKVLDVFDELKNKSKKLLFFDLGDGSSAWALDVLPFVDSYFKSYVYKNVNLYKEKFYGSRIWSDFYYRKFGIEDEVTSFSNVVDEKYLYKIKMSYNSSLADYSLSSNLYNSKYLKYTKNVFNIGKFFLNYPNLNSFKRPYINKEHNVSCRMNLKYSSRGVAYHRELAAQKLQKYLKHDKLSRELYFNEMSNSKIVVSPFGWGEVNYKDYEAILCGSLLLKPDMSHLKTYPNYFDYDKVLFYQWDYSDIDEKINDAIMNYEKYVEYAIDTQNLYKYYLFDTKAQEEFSKYFYGLIND